MRVEWLEKALKNLEDEANYIALKTQRPLMTSPMPFSPASTNWLCSLPWVVKAGSNTPVNGQYPTCPT